MKERSTIIVALLMIVLFCNAQVPRKFNYQAVLRDAQHAVIANQEVGLRISILAGSTDGPPLYVETHTVTTNAVGLATLIIGEGSVQGGLFEDIDWGVDDYFLQVEADPSGGSSYEYLGTSQLVSVPYALYSGNISSPTRKFTVQEEIGHPVDSALFEVRNAEGQTVFAVYPEGTRVYVLDEEAKGVKGGFAIGGYSRKAKGITQEYMRVTPDSIRMYFNEEATKGSKGGFAVGGYSRNTKGLTDQYFMLKPDSAKFLLVSDGDGTRANALSVITKPKNGDPATTGNNLLNLTIQNYLIGHRAGESMTDGVENCFLGLESGVFNTTGTSNVFIGQNSGYANLNGDNNSFIGTKAGRWSRVGHNNTFLGALSGDQQVDGDNNVYIGSNAGANKSEGFENVFIGCAAGQNNQDGSNNIFIGNGAGYNEKGNEKLIIDMFARDSSGALIFGDLRNGILRINNQLGIGRNASSHALEVEGSVSKSEAGDWMVNSDARIKTDIGDITGARQQIMKLHPVRFRYTDEWVKMNPSIRDIEHYNFVAQEFQQVFPDAVQSGGDKLAEGEPLLQLDSYPAQVVAIRAIQELIEENQSQQELIDLLLHKVEALEAEILQSR